MIRLFIYTFVQFIIVSLAIYAALKLFKLIIRTIQRYSQASNRYPNKQEPPKPIEHYTDVKDAKFVEMPDDKKEDNQNHSD